MTPTLVFVVLLALFPLGAWAEGRLFRYCDSKAAADDHSR